MAGMECKKFYFIYEINQLTQKQIPDRWICEIIKLFKVDLNFT